MKTTKIANVNLSVLIIVLLLAPFPALADFSGAYAPGNWTTTLSGTPPGGGGSVNTSGAPASITLNGGDAGCSSGVGSCILDFTITAPASGPVTFRWDYVTQDFPQYELFLLLDGVGVIQLSNSSGPNTQSGTQDFTVAAG